MGLSSKFRIGQVAGALSSGLGLFAEKKWKEEKEAEERAWQEHLQKVADLRAQARDDLEWERTLAANAQRFAMDAQGRRQDQAFTKEENRLNREARSGELGVRMSAEERARHDEIAFSRREMLEKTLNRIEERYEDQRGNALIAMDPEKMGALDTKYKNDRDRAIGSYVQSMMMRAQEYPEIDSYSDFRIQNRDEIAGLLENEGATYEGANAIADRWMKWMSDPGADDAGAGAGGGWKPDGIVDSTGQRMGWTGDPSSNPTASYGVIDKAPPPPPTGAAAQVDPTPQTPMPGQSAGPEPQPGSLRQLFNAEPVKNPDGTPKYPANKESLGYKLFDWMQQPTPYGQ